MDSRDNTSGNIGYAGSTADSGYGSIAGSKASKPSALSEIKQHKSSEEVPKSSKTVYSQDKVDDEVEKSLLKRWSESDSEPVTSATESKTQDRTPQQQTGDSRKLTDELRENMESPHTDTLGRHEPIPISEDTTVHFQLGLELDIDSSLEEFARLRRFGLFKRAEEHFLNNLIDHIKDPRIAVEYIDMLLEQGAIHRIIKFAEHQDFIKSAQTKSSDDDFIIKLPQPESSDNDKIIELYQRNFRLIENRASIAYRGDMMESLRVIKENPLSDKTSTSHFSTESKAGDAYIELQIYKNHFYIQSTLRQSSNLSLDFGIENSAPLCLAVYHQLVHEGRIWEFRDIFCAGLSLFGSEAIWMKFFEKSCRQPDCLDQLIEDWSLAKCDESSHMAILEILNALMECSVEPLFEYYPKVEWCLQHAEKVAGDMKTLNSETVNSRPYQRWVCNVEQRKRKATSDITSKRKLLKHVDFRYLRDFAGVSISTAKTPIYIPAGTENPGWMSFKRADDDDEPINIAMNVSRENGDYRTQAKCLGELICRSEVPNALIQELVNFLEGVMGDNISTLEVILTKYLLATDEKAEADLYNDLSSRSSISYRAFPILGWCRAMLEDTLSHAVGRPPTRILETKFTYEELPPDFAAMVAQSRLASYLPHGEENIVIQTDATGSAEPVHLETEERLRSRFENADWETDDNSLHSWIKSSYSTLESDKAVKLKKIMIDNPLGQD